MNKPNKIIAVIGLAMAGLLGGGTAAQAADCVPTDGQEYIAPTYATEFEVALDHEAVGTETIPNPDFVPGKDAWTETIEHPAVEPVGEPTIPNPDFQPAVPPVEEVSYLNYQYKKQVKGVIQTSIFGWWKDTGTFDWQDWGTTQWSKQNVAVLESGPHSAVFDETWTTRKVSTQYRYVPNGVTEKVITQAYVPGKDAVGTETIPNPDFVPGKDTWTETIEHPAVEPVGEPTIENPDYVEAWTEYAWVESTDDMAEGWYATGQKRSGEGITRLIDEGQPAIDPVVCSKPAVPVADPVNPAPTSEPTATPVAAPVAPALAVTGSAVGPVLGIGLAAIALGGLVVYLTVQRKRYSQR